MSWITKNLEEIKNKGYVIDVTDLNLEDENGEPLKEIRFGSLTEGEITAIERHPEIVTRRDKDSKMRLTGMRIIFERLSKIDSSLNWEEFKMLDQSIIDALATKIQDALGVGSKN